MNKSLTHGKIKNFFDNMKIKLASYLYINTKLANQSNLFARLKRTSYDYVWKLLIKMAILTQHSIVKVKIGNKYLFMNSSHNLPVLLKSPYYDTALPRISLFISRNIGKLIMIDIGANIGDTVCLITDVVNGRFLCVEPDEGYFKLLKINTQNLENVICEKVLISTSDDNDAPIKILNEVRGSAYLSNSTSLDLHWLTKHNNTTLSTTVDDLVNKYPEFSQTNLLKVDTDGYDIKVLKSAVSLLTKQKPIIFFEFSPWHLINVGGDDPLSWIEQSIQIGYSYALFYDWNGYPFMYMNLNETETLKQLISYAKRKPFFYYDILMFPDSKKDEFDKLYLQEVSCFPDFNKWH